MSCENIEPKTVLTQAEVRQAKIVELDTEQREVLHSYYEHCFSEGIRPNIEYIFENFGIGAGDVYNDQELDAMIARNLTEKLARAV